MSIFSKIGKAVTGILRPAASSVSSIFDALRPGTGSNRPPPPAQNNQQTDSSVSLVCDFADVLRSYQNTESFSKKAIRCAAYVKRPVDVSQMETNQSTSKNEYKEREVIDRWVVSKNYSNRNVLRVAYIPDDVANPHPNVSVNNPQVYDVADVKDTNIGSKARKNLLQFTEDVSAFATQAKNSGFSPPDNPFVEIMRLNSLRKKKDKQINVTESDAANIIFNIQVYVDLLEAKDQGAINLDAGVFNSAQLEHITLSYSGLGGSGNNAADLMKMLPDADDLKAKKAHDALAVLNFSRRVPRAIFTAEYNPSRDDGSQGILLGWKKIPDAAGYIVKRHSVIANQDVEFDLPNETISKNESYMEYARAYILNFYDNIKPESVCLFLDDNAPEDDFQIYRIQAYQVRKENSTSIIPSNFVAMNLSGQQKLDISNRMKELDPGDIEKLGEETISPWPVIAEQILGDASLDWVLAASNIRNAIDKNELRTISRKFSYLNAHYKFLLEQSDAGKLVRPVDMSQVRDAISKSISTFGITQTIEALLQETGILYYFDARDSREDTTFDRAGTLDFSNSGIIGTVVSAIDPENATIDLRSLATNLAQVLSDGKLEDYKTSINVSVHKFDGSKPEEIGMEPGAVNDKMAESGMRFVSRLDEMSDNIVDLTTFDGISKFMRVIRVMSDFGPNRIQPIPPVAATPEVPAATTNPPTQNNTPRENTPVFTSDAAERAALAGKVDLAMKIERTQQLRDQRNSGSRVRRSVE
jgi:hypothetical protein